MDKKNNDYGLQKGLVQKVVGLNQSYEHYNEGHFNFVKEIKYFDIH